GAGLGRCARSGRSGRCGGCGRAGVTVIVVVHPELVFGRVDCLLAAAEKLVEESHRVRLLVSPCTSRATRVSQETAPTEGRQGNRLGEKVRKKCQIRLARKPTGSDRGD